jgi:hypothetical protein
MTGTLFRRECAAPAGAQGSGLGAKLMCHGHVSADHKLRNLAKSVTVE